LRGSSRHGLDANTGEPEWVTVDSDRFFIYETGEDTHETGECCNREWFAEMNGRCPVFSYSLD